MDDKKKTPLNSAEAQKKAIEIAAAAGRLGMEFNAPEVTEWIVAMSAAERETALAQDASAGIFGHHVALLDFDQADLDYLRRLAQKVRAARRPNVESAIAIAGSSAQGKTQLFPGDTDFFERVNIKAASEAEARQTLREIMRETALRAFAEPDIVLVEVNFGVYSTPVVERGAARAAGDPITWRPQDVQNGFITVQNAAGQPLVIRWDEAPAGLGWTYLGWIVADRAAGQIVLASNMLDVTWESPEGQLVALDGMMDPFFQEIYLEAEAAPIFTKIIREVKAGTLDAYADSMRGQVAYYTQAEPNYGKAAKRLYNLFRLTDELEAAAYLRELFDEPGARLYQVPGLLEAADMAHDERSGIDEETVIRQIDRVIRAVVEAAEGPAEADMVMALIRLRDMVRGHLPAGADWSQTLQDVRRQCSELVNEYFRVRLLGLPQIEAFIAQLKE